VPLIVRLGLGSAGSAGSNPSQQKPQVRRLGTGEVATVELEASAVDSAAGTAAAVTVAATGFSNFVDRAEKMLAVSAVAELY
jgi:VCBS repeat-containing protein